MLKKCPPGTIAYAVTGYGTRAVEISVYAPGKPQFRTTEGEYFNARDLFPTRVLAEERHAQENLAQQQLLLGNERHDRRHLVRRLAACDAAIVKLRKAVFAAEGKLLRAKVQVGHELSKGTGLPRSKAGRP